MSSCCSLKLLIYCSVCFLQQLIIIVAVVINNFHLFNNVDDFPFHSFSSSNPQSPVPLPLSPYVSQFTGDVLFRIF